MKVEAAQSTSACDSVTPTDAPILCDQDRLALERGVRAWAQELHVALTRDEPETTVCFSPASILPVIGLVALGMPEGCALESIKERLGVTGMSTDTFHQAIQSFASSLHSECEELTFCTANGIAYAPSALYESYLSRGKELYESENFPMSAEAVEEINAWVSEKTRTLIPKLLDSVEGVAVLLNALYFKGSWENEFDAKLTFPMTFTNYDGSTDTVQMMRRWNTEQLYFEDHENGFQMLELPFKGQNSAGDHLSMVAVLPKEEGCLDDVEKILTQGDILQNCRNQAYQEEIDMLYLPRMNLEYSSSALLAKMEEMGLPISASMSKAGSGVAVSQVIQKTKLKMDEKGAEGAAATAAILESCVFPMTPPIRFLANRPFALYIMAGDRPVFQVSVRNAEALEKLEKDSPAFDFSGEEDVLE